jgi:hypothetical protein
MYKKLCSNSIIELLNAYDYFLVDDRRVINAIAWMFTCGNNKLVSEHYDLFERLLAVNFPARVKSLMKFDSRCTYHISHALNLTENHEKRDAILESDIPNYCVYDLYRTITERQVKIEILARVLEKRKCESLSLCPKPYMFVAPYFIDLPIDNELGIDVLICYINNNLKFRDNYTIKYFGIKHYIDERTKNELVKSKILAHINTGNVATGILNYVLHKILYDKDTVIDFGGLCNREFVKLIMSKLLRYLDSATAASYLVGLSSEVIHSIISTGV